MLRRPVRMHSARRTSVGRRVQREGRARNGRGPDAAAFCRQLEFTTALGISMLHYKYKYRTSHVG